MITIRPCTHDSVGAVLALQRTVYPPSLVESEEVFRSVIACGWSYVICVSGSRDEDADAGELAGYLLCHPTSDGDRLPPRLHVPVPLVASVRGRGAALFIHDLCVHPRHRQRGLGTRLVARLVSDACARIGRRDDGHHLRICLVSLRAAAPFWQRLGFAPCVGCRQQGCRSEDGEEEAEEDDMREQYGEEGAVFMDRHASAAPAGL